MRACSETWLASHPAVGATPPLVSVRRIKAASIAACVSLQGRRAIFALSQAAEVPGGEPSSSDVYPTRMGVSLNCPCSNREMLSLGMRSPSTIARECSASACRKSLSLYENLPRAAFSVAAGILIGMGAFAVSADQTEIAPPQGSALLLEAVADGVQIYSCEAKGNLFEWAFKAPEANLFDKQGRQIGTHFAGPTWKMADGSAIAGEVIAKADAPEKGAVQWLLLRAKSHQGQGILADAAFIRRTDTKGGVAPTAGCDANHVSEQVRMRYSAIYQFFSAAKG